MNRLCVGINTKQNKKEPLKKGVWNGPRALNTYLHNLENIR